MEDFERLLIEREKLDDQIDKWSPDQEIQPLEFSSKSIGSPKIAIVVGHTKLAPGAYGKHPINEYEYSFNSEAAKRIASIANGKGVSVAIFYRDGIGIAGAYKKVNIYQPDAAIELHFNGATSPAATGTETLYGSVNPKSKALAKIIQNQMLRAINLRDRDLIYRPQGGDGRGTESVNSAICPSVLVEPFFGSNSDDCERIRTRVDAYLDCLVSGFLEYAQAGLR